MQQQATPTSTKSGLIFLALAILIFSASNSVFVKLNEIDDEIFNACTILCSSNLVGLFFMTIFFWKQLTLEAVYSLSYKDCFWLFLGSTLYSCLAPYFMMTGLSIISVETVAILQRMESINILILGYFCIGVKTNRWVICNTLLTLTGIVLTIVSPLFFGDSVNPDFGMLYILISGICNSLSLLISMKSLSVIPLAIVAVFRVCVGTILFHLLILAIRNEYMLTELYSAKVWMYMVWYGFVFVFLGQVCWLTALTSTSPLTVSVGTTTLFIFTIMWGIIILGKLPSKEEWIGFAIISFSIISSIFEKLYNQKVDDDCYSPLNTGQGDKIEPISLASDADIDLHTNLIQNSSSFVSVDIYDDCDRVRHPSLSDKFNRLRPASVDSVSVFGGFKGF